MQSSSTNAFTILTKRVLITQCVIGVVAATLMLLRLDLFLAGKLAVIALLVGVLIGLIMTVLSARGVKRVAVQQSGLAMLPLYTAMLWKLAVGAGGFIFAGLVLELDLIFVVVGFLLTQLGYLVALYPDSN